MAMACRRKAVTNVMAMKSGSHFVVVVVATYTFVLLDRIFIKETPLFSNDSTSCLNVYECPSAPPMAQTPSKHAAVDTFNYLICFPHTQGDRNAIHKVPGCSYCGH